MPFFRKVNTVFMKKMVRNKGAMAKMMGGQMPTARQRTPRDSPRRHREHGDSQGENRF
jgi:hypothetical protein